jgi:hypothetical protein
MNSIDYLDAIRVKHDCSDYRAAILIGVGRSQVSAIRNRKSGFGEVPALRIAELLDMQPQAVLAHLMAEKAPNDEVRNAWLQIVPKFAACMLFFIAQTADNTVYANSLHNALQTPPERLQTSPIIRPIGLTLCKYAA